MDFLAWLQSTALATAVAETVWAYPLLETVHAVGMAMLLGSLGLINLRVLGFKPELPLLGTRDLLPLAWLGFTFNAISGIALFTSDAIYFFSSYTFRVKLALILLAGVNAVLLGRKIFDEPAASAAETPSAGAKWLAGASLTFWVGAAVAGRLIAYLP
ncbi:MAG TPA: hypothetical protein VF329_03370 [Gammaproteobacteria bacterium]